MKKTFYGVGKLSEFSLNACHSGICSKKDRIDCDKKKQCLIRLTGIQESRILNLGITESTNYSPEHDVKLYLWRKGNYKHCKPIEFIIRRPKKWNVKK